MCKVVCWTNPSVCIVFSTNGGSRSKKNALYRVSTPSCGAVPPWGMMVSISAGLQACLRGVEVTVWLIARSGMIERRVFRRPAQLQGQPGTEWREFRILNGVTNETALMTHFDENCVFGVSNIFLWRFFWWCWTCIKKRKLKNDFLSISFQNFFPKAPFWCIHLLASRSIHLHFLCLSWKFLFIKTVWLDSGNLAAYKQMDGRKGEHF